MRAKNDPVAALDELIAEAEADIGTGARQPAGEIVAERVASLLPFWAELVGWRSDDRLMSPALRVAALVDDAAAAAGLLDPLAIHHLTPARAMALVGLVDRYGEGWLIERLGAWTDRPQLWRLQPSRPEPDSMLDWLDALPDLCRPLTHADTNTNTATATGPGSGMAGGGPGQMVARHLVATGWEALRSCLGGLTTRSKPSEQRAVLDALGPTVARILWATSIVGHTDLRSEIVEWTSGDRSLLPLGIAAVRTAGQELIDPEELVTSGVADLAGHCRAELQAWLDRPTRSEGDWSIELAPNRHACDDCRTLGRFLTDPSRPVLDWPIAKPRRQHIHQVIDRAELPVRHETRRTGRPYTLVLTKSSDLWADEAKARASVQADLDAMVRVIDRLPTP